MATDVILTRIVRIHKLRNKTLSGTSSRPRRTGNGGNARRPGRPGIGVRLWPRIAFERSADGSRPARCRGGARPLQLRALGPQGSGGHGRDRSGPSFARAHPPATEARPHADGGQGLTPIPRRAVRHPPAWRHPSPETRTRSRAARRRAKERTPPTRSRPSSTAGSSARRPWTRRPAGSRGSRCAPRCRRGSSAAGRARRSRARSRSGRCRP